MTSDTPKLSFDTLQALTEERGKLWGDPGAEFHFIEMGGEAGEALNKFKKLLRHRKGMVGGCPDLEPIADELGDVVICAALCAIDLGLDLGEIVARKFNKTSEKHGFPQRLNG